MTAKRKEIVSSLALILLGAGYLAYSAAYSLDTPNNPGPGVFPLIVGGILILLTLSQLIRSLKQVRKQTLSEDPSLPPTRGIRSKPVFLVLVFATYLLVMNWSGFFSSTFLFAVVSSRLIGAKDWGRPVALAAGIGLFCYLLFVVWLKLSMPRGFLF